MKQKKAEKKAEQRIEELNGGKTHPKEKESRTTGSEKLEKTKKAKEALPPFPPPPKGKESHFSPMSSDEEIEELDFEAIDIEEFCKDMVMAMSEIAHIFNKKIRVLDEGEKKLVGKPLSRIIIKHDLQKIAKDEVVLVLGLSTVVYRRVKEMRALDSPEKEVIK